MSQILCRAVTKTLPISDTLNYILIAKYHIFNARLNDHTPSHEKNGYQFTSHKDFVTHFGCKISQEVGHKTRSIQRCQIIKI